jgi:hypothetical protein
MRKILSQSCSETQSLENALSCSAFIDLARAFSLLTGRNQKITCNFWFKNVGAKNDLPSPLIRKSLKIQTSEEKSNVNFSSDRTGRHMKPQNNKVGKEHIILYC